MVTKDLVRKALQEHLPVSLKMYHSIRRRWMNRTRSAENVFSEIHRTNGWGDAQSVSGGGSTLEESEALRAVLPSLLQELGVTTFLDAPCGDFFWMRHVELPGVRYVGVDVVAALIEENRARFATQMCEFVQRDLTKDALPSADLIMCRDCFIHLPHAQVQRILRNFRATGARYLLTTHFPSVAANHDIVIGSFRPINLCLEPFLFPEPWRTFREGSGAAPSQRVMGLWRMDRLQV